MVTGYGVSSLKINLGLIGNAISKSRAPSLHKFLGKLHGIDVSYTLFDPITSDSASFARQLAELIDQGIDGCNVTFPFKQIALELIDKPDTACVLVGSTNTIRLGSETSSTNTDYSGFIRALRTKLEGEQVGATLIMGAGGVGRAVAFGVASMSSSTIHIFDPSMQRAKQLVNALCAAGFSAQVVDSSNLAEISQHVDGILNCSPIGHYQTPGLPIEASLIGPQKWAFDAVYTPLQTEFIQECRRSEISIISGFELFFYQGLDSFEFWTGIEADEHRVRQAFLLESGIDPTEI
jgi:shikimate dehydrogenase